MAYLHCGGSKSKMMSLPEISDTAEAKLRAKTLKRNALACRNSFLSSRKLPTGEATFEIRYGKMDSSSSATTEYS
jgi:hypothetical protein